MRRKQEKKRAFIVKLVGIGVLIAIAIWMNVALADNEAFLLLVNQFGYIGLFLSALISGFNVVVPVPVIALFPLFIEAGLHPVLTVLVVSVGMTGGDVLGMLIGKAGRDAAIITRQNTWVQKLDALRDKHPFLPIVALFVYAAAVPMPNELIVIPMAFLGIKWWKMIIALTCGNILFNTFLALGLFHLF